MAWLGSTSEEHFKILKALLYKERETEIAIQQQLIETSDIKTRVAEGVTWYPLVVKDWSYDQREYVVIEFERVQDIETARAFSYGAHVEIFSMNSSFQKGDELKATVGTVSSKHMQLFTRIC